MAGVGVVLGAQHQDQVAGRGHGPDGLGPVGRGVAEPVRVRAAQGREPGPQGRGRDRRVLHRDARHQHVGDPAGVRDLDRARADPGLGQDGMVRGLAQDRGQHREARLADEDHLVAPLGEPARLGLHPGDQRAGRVDHVQAALGGLVPHSRGDAVRRDQHGGAARHVIQGTGEDRAVLLQVRAGLRARHQLPAEVDRALGQGLAGRLEGPPRARAPGAHRAEQAPGPADRRPLLDRAAGRGHGHAVHAAGRGADRGGRAVAVQRGGDEQRRAVIRLGRVPGPGHGGVAHAHPPPVQQPANQGRGRAVQPAVRRVADLGGDQHLARGHHGSRRQAFACA